MDKGFRARGILFCRETFIRQPIENNLKAGFLCLREGVKQKPACKV